MSTIAFDQFALTRIADFARSLSRLHQASRRQLIDDDQIDREFNAVCMSVWGYTTDDISDELFSAEDHAFLDSLDEAQARIFAGERGYDLVDDQGMLTDWWGFCWMILAEKRGLLTAENRAAARAAIEEKYLAAPNVIGVIVGRECNSARFAFGGAAGLGIAPTVGGSSRSCGTGVSAITSALTGATLISPRRARTSAVNPG